MATDFPILLTGPSGQLGGELIKPLSSLGRVYQADLCEPEEAAPHFSKLDLADSDAIRSLVRRIRPSLIINPAAYTAVDRAESEAELSHKINALAPKTLGEEARTLGIPLVHYSTDYVFDGSGEECRDEKAETNPLGVYGQTKLAGEKEVIASGCSHLILRTSWVFSSRGNNFVKTMLRLGREKEQLSIIDDQIGSPTAAHSLAALTMKALGQNPAAIGQRITNMGGLYHVTCGGTTSWHGFAEEIFRQAVARGYKGKVTKITPISTSEYPTPATRPLNSRLNCSKFQQNFGTKPESWQQALAQVISWLIPD